MNTSLISHRMFVAALSHDENAVAKNLPLGGKRDSQRKNNSCDGQTTELTPHQLMLALMTDGYQPWEA